MSPRNTALIAGIVLFVALSGLTGASAGEPAQQNASDLDTHPEDGHYEVEVMPDGPGEVQISITLYYSPRSPLERRQAHNNTLEADWFRGGEILDGAMQYHNRSPQDFEVLFDGVNYQEYDDRIAVSRRVNWPGFMRDRDRVVLGPGFARGFEEGNVFEVQLDFYDWANWSSNFEEGGSAGEAGISYTWTIGEDPDPRLVLNRSDYKSHESDGLGPTPFVLPILAVALLVAAAYRRS